MDVKNVTFRTGGAMILDDVTASFPEGSVTVIFGPNGAGKTTLLRCLSGDLEMDSGAVLFDDREIDVSSDEWKRCIGVIPDAEALIEDLTVHEQLSLAATLFGIDGPEAARRVQSLIRLADLEDKRDQVASNLSAGMRKRLAVALALVHAPRILLFDEPLNGMDYASSETFFSLLDHLRAKRRTILISGHALSAMLRVADSIVELASGRVVGSLSIDDTGRSIESVSGRLQSTRVNGHNGQDGVGVDLEWLSP